jgi:hypothetical protein
MSEETPHQDEPVGPETEPVLKAQPEPIRHSDEKDEKSGGWDDEKDEKGQGWGRDPIGGLIWALILITVGSIFLAETSLHLFSFEQFGGAWNLIFLAVGVILLLEVALRLLMPAYRRPVSGTLVFSFILMAMGLAGIVGWEVTWPVFIIAVGVAMLISGLLRWR